MERMMRASAATPSSHPHSGHLNRTHLRSLTHVLFREARSDDLTGIAAEVTYHSLFAIPALLVVFAALAALVNLVTDVPIVLHLRTIIMHSAPGEAKYLLVSMVDDAVTRIGTGGAALGILSASAVALWSGSNGVLALIKAFNRAYDVTETRRRGRLRIMAMGLALLGVLIITAAFALVVFGADLGIWVVDRLGYGERARVIWDVLRWPVSGVLVIVFLAVLYYLGPNVEQSFGWISPGSVVAAIIWFLTLLGFKLYLAILDPGLAYGAFSGVILLMTMLYVTGLAFVGGIEINAVLERRYDPATVTDLAQHPQKLDRLEDVTEAQQHARELTARERRNHREASGEQEG